MSSLTPADARKIEDAFQIRLETLEWAADASGLPLSGEPALQPSSSRRLPKLGGTAVAGIEKSQLAYPEPRRMRDRDHVRFVAKQPCLICGRRPSDPHHLRSAQYRALGQKVSDEFTVPLCRGHHRKVHRCGDEAQWWKRAAIDPTVSARALWLDTHPQPTTSDRMKLQSVTSTPADIDRNKAGPNYSRVEG